MVRIVIYLFSVLAFARCSPYLTTQISNISNQYKGDSIYVVGPLMETRLQITKDSFTGDSESIGSAEKLTKKALHQLLDGGLKVKYDQTDPINSWRTKIEMDSLLNEFTKAQYTRCSISKKLQFPTKTNLILIPYLVWTKTTPSFEQEKCSHTGGGRIYIGVSTCAWTHAQAVLFLIDQRNREVLFFKYKRWGRDEALQPFEERVDILFEKCSRPMLRQLGHSKKKI